MQQIVVSIVQFTCGLALHGESLLHKVLAKRLIGINILVITFQVCFLKISSWEQPQRLFNLLSRKVLKAWQHQVEIFQ